MKRKGLLIAMVLPLPALAQSADQWMAWGDAALEHGDQYGASRFFGKGLEAEPGKMDLQWRMAEACRLSNQYDLAVANYQKVVHKDMNNAHPEALRWLAEMQMCTADYDAAEETWRRVRRKQHDPGSFLARRAENGIAGCKLARELMAHPEEVTIEHLPSTVNTYDSEFGGRIGPDSALYFTSLRGGTSEEGVVTDTTTYRAAVYRSVPKGREFNTGVPLEKGFDRERDNANAAWSSDGSHFYFTQCNAGSSCTINVMGPEGKPRPLTGLGKYGSTQPMVARLGNQDVLFFASDRKGGMGGMDIWMGNLDGANVTDVHPLGSPVNTPGNETCPFYDVAQKKLYFSSDFHPGLGGYDNFMSEHKDDVFGEPQNFKYPLNSPANDLYPTFDMATMSGLFTSNRVGSLAAKGETCCNDIYRFRYPMPEVEPPPPVDPVTVAAIRRITSLREKLPIRLYFHNDEPEPRSWDTLTRKTYEQTYEAYKALIPDYHKAWKGNTSSIEAIDGFFRDEVDQGFAQLNDFIALLEQALEEGQRIKLVVRGFASPLAKSDYNVNLSLRRIQSMINYLRKVDGGILVPYLEGTASNGGRLTIEKAPYGENRALAGVSDVLQDLQGSVYSVGASRERRIEIEQVRDMSMAAAATLESSVIDMGPVEQNKARQAEFVLRNGGGAPLRITGSRAECGCTHATIDDTPIPPGATRSIVVDFNGHAPEGPFKRSVVLSTDGDPATLELTITGTIVEPR